MERERLPLLSDTLCTVLIRLGDSVQSWKGIPYAEPPLGELRFELPRVLAPQSLNVVNTTTAPIAACSSHLRRTGFTMHISGLALLEQRTA